MAQRILGIDPGTQKVGWAVLERSEQGKLVYLASGCWRLGDSKIPLAERLRRLQVFVQEVVGQFQPSLLALESAFLGKNVRSALRLGEARGVVIANACSPGVDLLELPPAQVKSRVAGAGAANKAQIARLVSVQLDLPNRFASEDESDALAVALCGALESSSRSSTPCSAAPQNLDSKRAAPTGRRASELPPGATLQ
jgi:crossover junction endodeoxyribonuclease RuvC